jgi:PAS domain S-box-containing protein
LGRVSYYTTSNGLINNFVHEVCCDSNGILWIATDGGLASFNGTTFLRYDESTGLPYNKIWPILPSGREVYVGTQGKGVAVLNRQESVIPAPRIVIGKPVIEKQEVHLSWKAYSYWGAEFPANILTRYRVDNGSWSTWNKDRELTQTDLTHGEHVLTVQAKGLYGDYREEGRRAVFIVPPPLYLQPVFAVPIALLAIGLAALGFVFIVRKRRYDADLRQREGKFRAVTEMTHSAIFVYRDDFFMIFSNQGMERLTGYSREELQMMKVTDLLIAVHRKLFLSMEAGRRSDAPDPQRGEFIITTKGGAELWIDLSWGPALFEGLPATIGTAFDITERKQAELRIRKLASDLSSTEMRSRRTMAAFLHDTIGQALALSKMKVEALLHPDGKSSAKRSVEELYALLQDAIKTTRSFTFQLSPSILYDLGLVPALDWLIEEMQKQFTGSITFEKPILKISLSDEVRNILFEGTREALINAVKHGRAASIDVTIMTEDSVVTVKVHDKGVGFDLPAMDKIGAKQKSFGLYNLRERLKDVGGRLEIDSRPGAGTTMRLIVPLNNKEGESA